MSKCDAYHCEKNTETFLYCADHWEEVSIGCERYRFLRGFPLLGDHVLVICRHEIFFGVMIDLHSQGVHLAAAFKLCFAEKTDFRPASFAREGINHSRKGIVRAERMPPYNFKIGTNDFLAVYDCCVKACSVVYSLASREE